MAEDRDGLMRMGMFGFPRAQRPDLQVMRMADRTGMFRSRVAAMTTFIQAASGAKLSKK
jgi:hypothetical protein